MIRTRAAIAEDAPLLRAMVQALADLGAPVTVGSVESFLRHGFGPRPLYEAIIAEREGHALGMVLFYPDFSTHRGKPGVYIQDLFVEPACRGAGIGTMLLARALQAGAAGWEAAYLTLGVSDDNAAARRFYATLGFVPRGYDTLILEGAGITPLMAR